MRLAHRTTEAGQLNTGCAAGYRFECVEGAGCCELWGPTARPPTYSRPVVGGEADSGAVNHFPVPLLRDRDQDRINCADTASDPGGTCETSAGLTEHARRGHTGVHN